MKTEFCHSNRKSAQGGIFDATIPRNTLIDSFSTPISILFCNTPDITPAERGLDSPYDPTKRLENQCVAMELGIAKFGERPSYCGLEKRRKKTIVIGGRGDMLNGSTYKRKSEPIQSRPHLLTHQVIIIKSFYVGTGENDSGPNKGSNRCIIRKGRDMGSIQS